MSLPFALASVTSNGSPAFPALILDDEAAVALHALAGLAARLGFALPGSLDAMLAGWDSHFAALSRLVEVLADDPVALGYRGMLVPSALLTPSLLVERARQILRVRGDAAECLPVTVQAAAGGTAILTQGLREARPNLALAAVLGRSLYRAAPEAAGEAIAGWALALELVGEDGGPVHAPGTLALGPYLWPAPFMTAAPEAILGVMGRQVGTVPLAPLAATAPEVLSRLSQDVLLLAGDVVVLGPGPAPDVPLAGTIDTAEAVAPDFGRLRLAFQ